MTEGALVTLQDVRRARMCASGTRAFLKRHGLDWDEFRHRGLPVEVIEATGDAMALSVVEEVRNGRRK